MVQKKEAGSQEEKSLESSFLQPSTSLRSPELDLTTIVADHL
ncbi:hypothetical protein SLEP1_g56978 [Rubroshorea leprosula]|uniref:Uncharacterized protein n=1 Tax=Rubroshorea leprosula TaxID=152421 RepID=A0AAV5MK11_9ROSI|nr:hypothetical protein SLEP1_g56978 [Rubroshorea leprosula]